MKSQKFPLIKGEFQALINKSLNTSKPTLTQYKQDLQSIRVKRWKRKVAYNHQLKKFEIAEVSFRKGIISKNDNVYEYEWMTVLNAMKTIEGYILKKDANKSEFNLYQFCIFIESSAWYD